MGPWGMEGIRLIRMAGFPFCNLLSFALRVKLGNLTKDSLNHSAATF